MSLGFPALDQHFHLPLLGPNDHGLLAHPAHHVEGTLRFASQRQFERVLLNAPLNDLPQLLGNRKEAIGRTEAI